MSIGITGQRDWSHLLRTLVGSPERRRVFWVRIKELKGLLAFQQIPLLYLWVFQCLPLLQRQEGVVAIGTAGCCGISLLNQPASE